MPNPLPLKDQPAYDEDALRLRKAHLEILPSNLRTKKEMDELTSINFLLGFAQEMHDDALSNTF